MYHSYSNTKPHQKGKHLSKDDRITIQVMHSTGYSNRAIAREINYSPSTIVYDQKKHRIPLYWQRETIQSYQGTNAIDANAAVRACFFVETSSSTMFPTASISEADLLMPALAMLLAERIFPKDQVVSIKTLYNYVDLGLMDIKNIDLPEKVKRNTKARRARANNRILG